MSMRRGLRDSVCWLQYYILPVLQTLSECIFIIRMLFGILYSVFFLALLLLMPADDSRVSKAISGVCDCVCVCVSVCHHNKTKTAETKITKLATGISPSRYLTYQWILSEKVKGQDHTVKKSKKWPAWVMHSIECPYFSYNIFILLQSIHGICQSRRQSLKLNGVISSSHRSLTIRLYYI